MNSQQLKNLNGPLIGVVIVVILLVSLAVPWVTANNTEVQLRNQFTAQQKVNEATFDNVWKSIKQQAEVTSTERESFKETFVEIMNSQQGIAGNGSLASFFTQAKVDVSPELFSKLMTSIESQRSTFLDSQKKLLEIKRMHDNVLMTFPSSMFVGGRPQLEPNIVTSSKTSDVFEGTTEEDLKVF